MFFKGSRYERVESHSITDESGSVITYKKVRFISETHARMGHLVVQGDRLDNIAHRYYKDPERFWRICDANLAMWPDELVAEAGRIILIPPSEE
ncbi:MAG TPA: hypothetical protein PLQ38_04425 [Methanothrix sp.]|nr:hypothetical protein [Methanothrix sp.]